MGAQAAGSGSSLRGDLQSEFPSAAERTLHTVRGRALFRGLCLPRGTPPGDYTLTIYPREDGTALDNARRTQGGSGEREKCIALLEEAMARRGKDEIDDGEDEVTLD